MSQESNLVCVFRSTDVIDVKRAAEVLEWNGIPCSIEREAGSDDEQPGLHPAIVDSHSFVILVKENLIDHAGRLLGDKGFETTIEPYVLDTTLPPKRTSASMILVMVWTATLGALIIFLLYYFLHGGRL